MAKVKFVASFAHPAVPALRTGARPAVSVICPVRDTEAQVRLLVEALTRQTIEPSVFEIVIADDGSTHADAVAQLTTEDGHVRVLPGPRLNSYAARNRAVEHARADAIACCDADCRPEPDWLEQGVRALGDADIVAGQIRFILPDRVSVWGLLDIDGFLDQEVAVRHGYAVTANLFLRREQFDRVAGFDDSQPNQGDYDFVSRCVAAGAKLAYAEDAVVWHPMRNRGGQFLRKVWNVNRRYAEREASKGRKPEGLKLRSWVPVLQTARGRLRAGKPLGLNHARLTDNGVNPRILQELLALPLLYFVVPYLRCFAQLYGWRVGKRARLAYGANAG